MTRHPTQLVLQGFNERARQGALNWFGTQCSAFLVLCARQHQRKESNGFLGDETRPWVKLANKQMEVVSLMFFLSWMIGNEPVLEQPQNSVLPKIKPLSVVLQCVATKTCVRLGAYGAPTAKPLQLWHCDVGLRSLARRMSVPAREQLFARHVDSQGRVRFTGKKASLKESAAYTPDFASAVATVTRSRLPVAF